VKATATGLYVRVDKHYEGFGYTYRAMLCGSFLRPGHDAYWGDLKSSPARAIASLLEETGLDPALINECPVTHNWHHGRCDDVCEICRGGGL